VFTFPHDSSWKSNHIVDVTTSMDGAEKVHDLVFDLAFELASLRRQRGLLDETQQFDSTEKSSILMLSARSRPSS
jgi:hypothetical protein